MDSQIIQKIKDNYEKFAIDLYKSAAEENKGNFTISPFGIYLLSTVATYGASDDTKEQLKTVLGLSNDSESLQGFETLMDYVTDVTDTKISFTNKIVVSDFLPIKAAFNESLKQYSHFYCEALVNHNTEETVKKINDWCKKKTENKSSEIISKDDLNNLYSILLLNTVYFKGDWEKQFLHQFTKVQPFYVDEKTQKEVPMMFIDRDRFLFGELGDVDAKFVKIPYKFPNFKMVLIVPNQINGLEHLEKNLDKITYDRIDKNARTAHVNLRLPKFKIDNTIDLKKHLEKMGLTKMFSDSAKFNNLTSERAKVSKFAQKAIIVVDEGGSKQELKFADAFGKLKEYNKEEQVHADRPFLAILVYKNLPLFYSRFTG